MKTLAEKIEVMKAALDGKPMQLRDTDPCDNGLWRDTEKGDHLSWNWSRYDYRIKPEPPKPIEIWVNVYSSGKLGGAWKHRESAEQAAEIASGPCKAKLFREVLEVVE